MDAYYTPTDLGEIVILEMAVDGIRLPSPDGEYEDSYEDAMADIRAFYEEYATRIFEQEDTPSDPSLTLEDWTHLQSICHFDLGFGGGVPMLEDTPDSSIAIYPSDNWRFFYDKDVDDLF